MDNNYRTIFATSQKSSPTPAANQRTFSTLIKVHDFFFSIERKKSKLLLRLKGKQWRKKYK
jgi:hypothetical protein